ncbi:MAG: Uma2 family endonuclease [Vicinamibacterales bacterium]
MAKREQAVPVKLTHDDFVHFPADGLRHELIDGAHFVTPAPDTRHQTISMNLIVVMGGWLDTHPIGRLYHAPFDVRFSDVDVVVPDLLYLSNERRGAIVTATHVRGVPELVIEIGSPSTRQRDKTIKRQLYERSGVAEFWFVDPDIDVVRVYRRDRKGFAPAFELSYQADDILSTPLLPGFDAPLTRVFRD